MSQEAFKQHQEAWQEKRDREVRKVKTAIEEAVALAERFPDLPQSDVIDHVNEVVQLTIPYDDSNIMYRAVIEAYAAQHVYRGFDWLKAATGIDYS
jgi:microcompartment protein CcmL/EutN